MEGWGARRCTSTSKNFTLYIQNTRCVEKMYDESPAFPCLRLSATISRNDLSYDSMCVFTDDDDTKCCSDFSPLKTC